MNTAIRNSTPERELALQGARSDPAQGKWSTLETLLAALIDEVRYGNWAFVQAHSEQSVTRPTPIRRPGLPARAGKVMSLEDARRIDPRLRGLPDAEAEALFYRFTGQGGEPVG